MPLAIHNGCASHWPSQGHVSNINYIFVPFISHTYLIVYIFLHCCLAYSSCLFIFLFSFGLFVLRCQSCVCQLFTYLQYIGAMCACAECSSTHFIRRNEKKKWMKRERNGKHFSGCSRFINCMARTDNITESQKNYIIKFKQNNTGPNVGDFVSRNGCYEKRQCEK